MQRLLQVLSELEKLKPEAQKELKRLNSSAARVPVYLPDTSNQYVWPPVSQNRGAEQSNGQVSTVINYELLSMQLMHFLFSSKLFTCFANRVAKLWYQVEWCRLTKETLTGRHWRIT